MKDQNRGLAVACGLAGFLVTQMFLAAPAPLPARPQTAATEDQIKKLERDRQDAFVRGDIAALDQETAEAYTTINSGGRLSTKPQMMKNLREGKTKVLFVNLSEMNARVYGNTAVLTGVYNDASVTDGVRKEGHARFMRIFVKMKDRWQAVAYQQTAIPDVR